MPSDWTTARKIGIAACSGPGAALCYETITSESSEFLGPLHHPEIALHAFSFGEHVRLLEAGDWKAIGQLLADSAAKLALLGAELVVCPDNTVHQAMDHVQVDTVLPWIHIAEEVAREAGHRGFRRLGILGTRFLMEGPVYSSKLRPLAIESFTPPASDRELINSIIFDHLVYNRIRDEDRDALLSIIERLQRDHDCDAITLGCTELPLILNDTVSPLPTLDSTRLLARAAIAHSVSPRPSTF